jgi:hypothetical protein
MAANKIVRFGPLALTATLSTNILNPPTLTGGTGVPGTTVNTYFVLRHIRITNKTASAATFTLYIGATGGNVAGTEFMGTASSVPANSAVDWYGYMSMDIADFLVGGASALTTLTLQGEGEIGVR